MAKTSESPFAASLCQNAIPVEATWKPILLRKRKTPSEKPGSELGESVNIILEKRQSCAADDHGDDIDSSTAHSSRDSWSDNRKSDGDQFQVCRGSFHQSWHEDFQCPGQQCSSITLTSLLYTAVTPVESWKASDLDQISQETKYISTSFATLENQQVVDLS